MKAAFVLVILLNFSSKVYGDIDIFNRCPDFYPINEFDIEEVR